MTELERRVRALKQAFVDRNKRAPIALHVSRTDERRMKIVPPSFLPLEIIEKLKGQFSVRRYVTSFEGLQIIWDARKTHVE